MKPITGTIASSAFLAACANSGANYQPILDGPSRPTYHSDLTACQTLAQTHNHFDQKTLEATLLGTGAGAAVGELDDNSNALGGALAGGIAGAVNASEQRESIVVQCLHRRGHRIVG